HRLPPNACLLTFDDGFLDHFTTVLPRLVARGLTAGFYPPAAAVEGRRLLDTHKIQLILAACDDTGKLARRLLDLIDAGRGDDGTPSGEALWRQHAVASRFDGPEVIFVKRVLQRGLPEALRSALAQRLLEEYIGVDEATLAHELTTRVDVAHDLTRPLELPRLDTNDLPISAATPPDAWTVKVLGGERG